jgi:hypothetical protein
MPLVCPKCSSLLISRPKETGLADKLLATFSGASFECQVCHHRFRVNSPKAALDPPAQDRRKAARQPANIPVRFECGAESGDGMLTDLSADGCALDSQRKLRPGLVLRLHLPAGTDASPHATMSQIATVRSVDGTRNNLKFLAFTEPEKEQLEDTVTKTMTKFKIY